MSRKDDSSQVEKTIEPTSSPGAGGKSEDAAQGGLGGAVVGAVGGGAAVASGAIAGLPAGPAGVLAGAIAGLAIGGQPLQWPKARLNACWTTPMTTTTTSNADRCGPIPDRRIARGRQRSGPLSPGRHSRSPAPSRGACAHFGASPDKHPAASAGWRFLRENELAAGARCAKTRCRQRTPASDRVLDGARVLAADHA